MTESKEQPCPDCGEMVRINSLRCWNCGAFMDRALEEKYLEMQNRPQQTIYSNLPDDEVTALADDADDDDDGDGDDFELSVSKPTLDDAETTANPIPLDPANPDATASPPPPPERAGASQDSDDDLFDIAMQEQRQRNKQRRKRSQRGGFKTPGGGLIIFCPYGCRIVVKESHRGMQGKCPECRAPFIVPVDPPNFKKDKPEDAGDAAAATGGFDRWIADIHLHTVNPEKLKLKADSLLKEFVSADFGFSDDQLISVVLSKKGKKEENREALRKQLAEGKSLAELDAAEKYEFSQSDLSQLKIVQPTASRTDSIFHGIAVFGEGRIALQLPHVEGKNEILYISMGITQFWEFQKVLEEKLGITGLSTDGTIPAEATYTNYRCHYLETQIKALDHVDLFRADETVELEAVGYKCEKCNTTISEEGRKRENLGGKTNKGIPKAKCPKCSNKMGDNFLYDIKQSEDSAAASAAS